MSVIGLVFVGVKQASEFADDASVIQKNQLNTIAKDTLYISMNRNTSYSKQFGRHSNELKPVYDENNKKLLYRTDVRLILKSTKDSVASMEIEKNARGKNYQDAKMRAGKIDYGYTFNNNKLGLNGYLTTDFNNKFRDQEVEITLYIPEGTILFVDENTYSFHRNMYYSYSSGFGNERHTTRIIGNDDLLDNGMEGHYLQMMENELKCLDCTDDDFKVKVHINDDDNGLKIDENGIEIKRNDTNLKINDDGIKGKSDNVKVNIDKNGIEISSDNN